MADFPLFAAIYLSYMRVALNVHAAAAIVVVMVVVVVIMMASSRRYRSVRH
jgi:hypothetical protein